MKLFIIPKPVLDSQMTVASYCFRYKRADTNFVNQPMRAFEDAASPVCLAILESVGLDGFTNGTQIFVPITGLSLFTELETQCSEPPEKIIFLLNNDVQPEEGFINNIKRLKDIGFRFALENVKDYSYIEPILELCDFLFISASDKNNSQIAAKFSNRYKNLSLVLSDVDDMDTFDGAKYSSYKYFEGKFYVMPVSKEYNAISPIKVNSIQLMNIVRDDNFEIENIVKVVSQDPSLSIALLKFVNSPYLGVSQQIKTIQHAVAMLGQKEVRKWVTTATTEMLASDKPDEITKLSLMRAKFAENLAPAFEMAIHSPSLFMAGLFSILDVVLEVPMDEALKMISVSDEIRNALVSGEGKYAIILELIYAYEAADWSEVYRLSMIHNIDISDIYNSYIEAVRWYKSIVNAGIEV